SKVLNLIDCNRWSAGRKDIFARNGTDKALNHGTTRHHAGLRCAKIANAKTGQQRNCCAYTDAVAKYVAHFPTRPPRRPTYRVLGLHHRIPRHSLTQFNVAVYRLSYQFALDPS